MKTIRWKCQVVGLLVVVLSQGCSRVANVMVTRTLSVAADPDVCKKSVEVHLVGVNRFEKDRWENMSMAEYWQPENPLRKGAASYTQVLRFGREPCTRTLEKKDPILAVWKKRKAEYLFVLADLPGLFQDMPGNADARRLRVPALESTDWGWQKEIDIAVNNSDIVALVIPQSKSE
jgi:hypothetical protein